MFKIRNLNKGSKEIGSITKFKIDRYATSLLGGVQADVVIGYSNKKEIMNFGDDADVYNECVKGIKAAKNPGRVAKLLQVFQN